MHVLVKIFFLSIAIFVVAEVMPAVKLKNFGTAIVVAIVYSIVSFFLSWLIMFMTLPLMIITFGLFKLVINAFLLWLTDIFIKDFKIDGVGPLLLAAFLITVFDWLLHYVVM